MKQEDREYIKDALRLVDDHTAQNLRVLRKVRAFYETPDAQTRSDVQFEVGILKSMCGGKRDGTIPKDDGVPSGTA